MDKWDTIKDNFYLPVLVFVFLFSVLLAWFMVARSRVLEFSDLYDVPCSGVSSSLPSGLGWSSSGGWRLASGNQFVFVSGQETADGVAEVQLVYKYAWAGVDSLEAVTEVVNLRGGEIIEGGTRETPAGQMEWAQVQTKVRRGREVMVFRDLFVGAVMVGEGGVLVLTSETSGDEYYSRELFDASAGKVRYSEPAGIEEAANTVGYFKARQFGDIVERLGGEEEFFLLKGNVGSDDSDAAGFYGQRMGEGEDGTVWLENVYYKAGGSGGYFVRGQFRCGAELESFVWRTQQQGRGGGETEVVLGDDGLLTVRGIGGSSRVAGRYRAGRRAVADTVFDMFVEEAVDAGAGKLCVEVILRTGQILPAVVEVERTDRDERFDGQRVCERAVVRLAYEDGGQVIYYFDCDGRLVGKEENIGGGRTVWVRRDKADLPVEFEGFEGLYELK
jgi:hypothetical protein